MRLRDGHQTLLQFPTVPGLRFWTKDITPPGVSGGGANDTTVMENEVVRTFQPKHLFTLTQADMTVQYDPFFYVQVIENLLLKNQLISVHFPDTSQLIFYGWLDEFKPEACKEGEPPLAKAVIIPSNQDNSDPPIEIIPEYLAP